MTSQASVAGTNFVHFSLCSEVSTPRRHPQDSKVSVHPRSRTQYYYTVLLSCTTSTVTNTTSTNTMLEGAFVFTTCVVRRIGWALPVPGAAGRRNVPLVVCVRIRGGA